MDSKEVHSTSVQCKRAVQKPQVSVASIHQAEQKLGHCIGTGSKRASKTCLATQNPSLKNTPASHKFTKVYKTMENVQRLITKLYKTSEIVQKHRTSLHQPHYNSLNCTKHRTLYSNFTDVHWTTQNFEDCTLHFTKHSTMCSNFIRGYNNITNLHQSVQNIAHWTVTSLMYTRVYKTSKIVQ